MIRRGRMSINHLWESIDMTIIQYSSFLRRSVLLFTINASCVLGTEIHWDKGLRAGL